MARSVKHSADESYAELFRFLVQELGEYAIFSCDVNNKIRTWNAGVQRVLGYRQKEFIGRAAAMIFTPEDRRRGAVEREMGTAARSGRASDERWHLRKNGQRFWGSGVMMAQRDASGKLSGFVKI